MKNYQIAVATKSHSRPPKFLFRTEWLDDEKDFRMALGLLCKQLPKSRFSISYYTRQAEMEFTGVQ